MPQLPMYTKSQGLAPRGMGTSPWDSRAKHCLPQSLGTRNRQHMPFPLPAAPEHLASTSPILSPLVGCTNQVQTNCFASGVKKPWTMSGPPSTGPFLPVHNPRPHPQDSQEPSSTPQGVGSRISGKQFTCKVPSITLLPTSYPTALC
jgi:hypothetical protein